MAFSVEHLEYWVPPLWRRTWYSGIPPSKHTPQLVNFRTGDRDKAFHPHPPLKRGRGEGKAGLLMNGFRSQEVMPPPSPRASCLLF